MTQFLQILRFLTLIGILEIGLIAIKPRIAQAQLPKPPNTGTPTGNPTPATTRPQESCPKTNKPLTALIANNGNDYTIKEYPTLWFYIPYSSLEIKQLEFVLLDRSERQTIYRTGIKLTDKPGIIQITIPSNPKYALKANATYRWYLMLDCQNDQNEEPALVVNGWISRLTSASAEADTIWYDRINDLAKQHFAEPQNQEIYQAWVNLLKSLGYTWLVQEPLAESSLISLSD